MKRVYLYIDGYRNLKDAEFNFTQDVCLRFSREKSMEKKRNYQISGKIGRMFLLAFVICSMCACGKKSKIEDVDDAIKTISNMGEELGYENALSDLSEKNITTFNEETYYRLQQNYEGIPVYGKNVVCVVNDEGEVDVLTGNDGCI